MPEIMRIECASFPTPWHEVSMRSELQASDDRRLYLAVETEGELAGYIGAHFYADEVHIGTLAVAPEHRRCGIGELLLLQMLEIAIARGVCYATLEYRADNKPAQKLYEKTGFQRVRVRKGYYRDTGEDAVVVAIDDLDTEARKQAIHRLYEEAKERQQHDIYVEC
ncbi:MAG: ribosomal protein S18-alanine N-acetyltransferase [Armatimonadota bacterium]